MNDDIFECCTPSISLTAELSTEKNLSSESFEVELSKGVEAAHHLQSACQAAHHLNRSCWSVVLIISQERKRWFSVVLMISQEGERKFSPQKHEASQCLAHFPNPGGSLGPRCSMI